MAEYIEREALIDEINIAPVSMSICINVDECKGRIYERERLVRIINAIPAADVVPVRHGKWIVKGQDIYCSECNAESAYNQFGASKFSRYCPNCGARMDAEEREKRIRKTYIDVGSCRGWIVEGGLDKDGDGG